MKNTTLLTTISVFLLMGAGCQTYPTQEHTTSLPPAAEELQTQAIPEPQKLTKTETTPTLQPVEAGTSLYRGTWFDIAYPQRFTARPTTTTHVYNGITHVNTDEAYFTSPDGTVEFFVYSPLWSGNPEQYLTVAPTETLVGEKTEETKENDRPGQRGDRIVRWGTIQAKDNSYYRSFVSIKEQVGTGSEVHHVFGIRYQDTESYEKYKEAYVAFKNSLQQYAD